MLIFLQLNQKRFTDKNKMKEIKFFIENFSIKAY